MDSKKIAIVCDGKEISYGFNLLHLFQYKNKKEIFTSNMIADVSVDIYSAAMFRHTNISQKTIKIFVGDVQKVDLSYKKVFCQYGMTILKSELEFVLKAYEKELAGDSYDKFILYANKKRNEYIDFEKQYAEHVESLDPNWIAEEFNPVLSKGSFNQKSLSKSKIQQQYDCLAFVLYLDIIRNKGV